MIISVISPKGGVGKTTTTMHLAAALHDQGKHVHVLDLDPQGGALDWAERAELDGHPLNFPVTGTNSRRLDATDADVTIIDGPPGDPKALDAARDLADLVILPCRTTPADLTRIWDIRPALDGTAWGVLLTSVRAGTSAPQLVRDQLDEENVPRFASEIPLREDIALSHGTDAIPHPAYTALAHEIMEA